METVHGAELILLSFPEQTEGEYVGGLLTLATPMGKNWHWLRADDYPTVDAMLVSALDYAKRVGFNAVKVRECHMVEEYMVASDDEEIEGEIDLDAEC